MTKRQILFLVFVTVFFFFLPAGSAQTGATAAPHANQTSPAKLLPADQTPHFAVCKGTFALCTQALCEPVINTVDGKKEIGFSCKCKVEQGYSAGAAVPGDGDQCKSVPAEEPYTGQHIPSRFAPVKSYVACEDRKRPWAWCLDVPCVVDAEHHKHPPDKPDPDQPLRDKPTRKATCACSVATGAPFVASPPDGEYSLAGCTQEYISSATVADFLNITEFLTTPQGKDLRPTLPILLVPEQSKAPPKPPVKQ